MKQILSEEFKRMQELAGIEKLNENEEFENDFPLLNYNSIIKFIENKGYKVTSDYYDGGFDVNDGEYFIGMFDNHIAVTDSKGEIKTINFS